MHWFKTLYTIAVQRLHHAFKHRAVARPLYPLSSSLASPPSPAFSSTADYTPLEIPFSTLAHASVNDVLMHLSRSLYDAPMGCVILGSSYQVIWFNPIAAQWLGLREHDVHRPLTHILRSPEVMAFLNSPQYRLIIEQGRSHLRLQHISLLPGLSLLEIEPEDNRANTARVQRQFLGAVSHELNTPLTVLSGFLEILETTTSHSEREAILETLRHQIARLQGLSHQLLQLLRTEHTAPQFKYWDAISFFGRIEHEIHAIDLGERTILWNIDGTLDLYGDESQLYSAFRNLIDNAIRYTAPQSGKIRIGWFRNAQGNPTFEVHDNGRGIAPEHLSRLGERFYRAGNDDVAGTGLGLSIVKEVIQQHHAELSIDSTVNKGSCFRITLRKQIGL